MASTFGGHKEYSAGDLGTHEPFGSPPGYYSDMSNFQSAFGTQNPNFPNASASIDSQYPMAQNFNNVGPQSVPNQLPPPPPGMELAEANEVVDPHRTAKRIAGACVTLFCIGLGIFLRIFLKAVIQN